MQDLNNRVNNLNNSGGDGARPWSILQDKAIQSMTKMGNDKSKWRNWLHKLKNVLGDVVKDKSWAFWMEVAELNFKSPEEIKDQGELNDASGEQKETYDKVAQ